MKMNKHELKLTIKHRLAKLKKGDEALLREIVQDMVDWDLDPTLIYSKSYSPDLLKYTDKMKDIIDNPPPPSTEERVDTEEGEGIPLETKVQLGDFFMRRGQLNTDTNEISKFFLVKDLEKKLLTRIKGTHDEIIRELRPKVGKELQQSNHELTGKSLTEFCTVWEDFTNKILVKHHSSAIDPEHDWCLYYSPHRPDATVPFPKLKETLDRMSEGDAFAAWIWGVYSGQYKGRQMFWIHGEEGEEGKSYLAKFLGKELFGENAGYRAIDGSQIKNGSNFLISQFTGAKLVVYPDCNRIHLVEMELIKSLSSGGRDSLVSEEKFGAAQTVTVDAKLLVCSNFAPVARRDNWYQSRLIYCTILPLTGKKDPDIDKVYTEELPGFLAYAQDCYKKLCKNHEKIELSKQHKKLITDLIDKQDPFDKDIFARHFVLDPKSYVSYKKVKDILEVQEGIKGNEYKRWAEWLVSCPGISTKRMNIGFVYDGFREINTPAAAEVTDFTQLDKDMEYNFPAFQEQQ